MKCPKCGYLGFEHVDRCRNCGYDFSLSSSIDLPDLVLRPEPQTMAPLDDLAMLDDAVPIALRSQMSRSESERAEPRRFEPPAPERPVPPVAPKPELPLFNDDLEPLIRRASPPRPPLSVRRATPEVPRLRNEPQRNETLEFDMPMLAPMPPTGVDQRATGVTWPPTVDAQQPSPDAGFGARFAAAVIDLLILGAIDAVVIYFTMQICGIGIWDLGIVPKVPLLAFLLVLDGGYLVVFTAGGQTLGKMVAGIKVVTAGSGAPIDLGRSVLRTFVWLLLAIPAGLGFVTALYSGDRRGLHDRVARTRVVRASPDL